MNTKNRWSLLSLLLVGAFVLGACATPTPAPTQEVVEPTQPPAPEPTEVVMEPVTIALWHQEGEAENAAQYVQALADAYTAMYPNVTFEVTNKETEVLREDFQTAALAGAPPSVLWTVSDHAR